MRKLQVSNRFGEIYRQHSPLGSLTLFCPSCPQPGINLPPDWKDLPSWVTCRTITVEAIFMPITSRWSWHQIGKWSRIHGRGGAVQGVFECSWGTLSGMLIEILQSFYSFENLNQRPSCQNNRAVNAAQSNNRCNLDVTGVIACCCARHGCFIPNSVCDLQKGEQCKIFTSDQQKNSIKLVIKDKWM